MSRPKNIFCALLMLAVTLAAGNAFAQTKEIDSQRKKIEELESDISYLDNQIQAVQKQKSNTLEELVLIQNKIAGRKNLLAELDIEIKQHNNALNTAQNDIRQLNIITGKWYTMHTSTGTAKCGSCIYLPAGI